MLSGLPDISLGQYTIYKRFFFGDVSTGTPAHTAYTIGYHIVQAYRKAHLAYNVVDLMNMEAQTILAECGYTAALFDPGKYVEMLERALI